MDPLALPPSDLLSAPSSGERAGAWQRGVALGALGRYGDAFIELEALDGADRWVSLASSTLGSLHRQLGRYLPARALDLRALDLAADAEARVEALLGLAADAVGLAETDDAAGHLGAALAVGGDPGWRPRVRSGWVAAEVAFLRGDAGPGLEAAEASVRAAHESGSGRHLAKSLLFRCVGRLLTGDAGAALDDGEAALRLALALGTRPLVWPAVALLRAPGLAERLPADRLGEVRAQGRGAVLAIATGLPRDLAGEWLAKPDVAALLR
ncbi:hypothetical protein ACIB24_14310 [Spongisporangium articulatum]|uniref:Uncharacterized protein n=1 Tax=Spongisporangium articulatum TaxID=3362603 RepID=A0ABW8APC9_9ACTN